MPTDAWFDALPEPLQARARAAGAWIGAQDQVLVVHHVDADGVTSGAIAMECLARAGIAADNLPVKSLDDVHLDLIRKRLAAMPGAGLWFCDLGSTAYMHFPTTPRLVCDHHNLVRDGDEETFAHLNPRLDDLDGDTISGAGCAFLAAYCHDARNLDLLPMAMVGAAADLQDRTRSGSGGFHGANAVLAEAGEAEGLLEVGMDLAWFGPETRPLTKFLRLGREPTVPTVTGHHKDAATFLQETGIETAGKDGERTYADLTDDERLRLRSAIVRRALQSGVSKEDVEALFRPVVRICDERDGTPTRELREFGTLLNSTARYDEPATGVAVARGDRGDAYEKALGLLGDHRKHLVGALEAIKARGVTEGTHVQWVHLEDAVRDTVVGIVCGMALEALSLRQDLVILGFAHTPDGRTKVSSRRPRGLAHRGVDLSIAMREAAAAFDGQGGGHAGAAGATIPRGSEEAFLAHVEAVLATQVTPSPTTPA